MRWCLTAWEQVKQTTITNCWRHTGILEAAQAEESEPADVGDIVENLLQDVRRLQLRDPMSLEEILNPDGESVVFDEGAGAEVNAANAPGLSVDDSRNEEDCGTGNDIDVVAASAEVISIRHRIDAVRITILTMEAAEQRDVMCIASLRKLQRNLRRQWQESFRQVGIERFLISNED